MYFSMLATPEFEQYHLSSLTKAGIGGCNCPSTLCKRITEKFQINGLIIGYGLSEAASLCTLSDIYDPEEIRLQTAGRALPGLEVTLANAEGKADPTITQGEILVRGYGVMKGYYKDEVHTKEALDENGWLHTGDIGQKSTGHTFRIVDRLKDIIIKGGENISPGDIEEKILLFHGIRQCQCVGVPDEKYGEEVCACIIPADETNIDTNALRSYLKENISSFKVPRYYLTMESFPVNGSGKVVKEELKQIAREILGLSHIE